MSISSSSPPSVAPSRLVHEPTPSPRHSDAYDLHGPATACRIGKERTAGKNRESTEAESTTSGNASHVEVAWVLTRNSSPAGYRKLLEILFSPLDDPASRAEA